MTWTYYCNRWAKFTHWAWENDKVKDITGYIKCLKWTLSSWGAYMKLGANSRGSPMGLA